MPYKYELIDKGSINKDMMECFEQVKNRTAFSLPRQQRRRVLLKAAKLHKRVTRNMELLTEHGKKITLYPDVTVEYWRATYYDNNKYLSAHVHRARGSSPSQR